jgi:hypothetical protein
VERVGFSIQWKLLIQEETLRPYLSLLEIHIGNLRVRIVVLVE